MVSNQVGQGPDDPASIVRTALVCASYTITPQGYVIPWANSGTTFPLMATTQTFSDEGTCSVLTGPPLANMCEACTTLPQEVSLASERLILGNSALSAAARAVAWPGEVISGPYAAGG